MSNLTNPLQALINQAAKLPKTGEVERYAERINYDPTAPTIVLLDVSGSMDETVESGDRKIDVLRKALARPLSPGEFAFAFSSLCQQIQGFEFIPEPSGGTALHYALETIAPHRPKSTLVVSDGRPDNGLAALQVAHQLTGTISTLYIGPDDDLEAIAFMQRLARQGCGRSDVCDIRYGTSRMRLRETINLLLEGSND